MVFRIFTNDDEEDERISQEIATFSTSDHQLDKLVFVGFEDKRDCINLLSFYAHVKAKSHRDTGVIELSKERDYVGIYNELLSCDNFESDHYQLIFPLLKNDI